MVEFERRTVKLGDATRYQLIDAATRLFAQHGVDAASVRAINREAGHAPAAVHYHFGSKDELLKAVIARRLDVVGVRTAALDAQLARAVRRPAVADLVQVMATPYLELLQHEPLETGRWLAVVAQLRLSRRDLVVELFEPVTAILTGTAMRCFPHAPAADVRTALVIANGALLGALVQSHGTGTLPDVAALVEFAGGGFAAVLSRAGVAPLSSGGPR